MLAVQPVSLADALLFDSPRFLARKRQCLRLPCNSAAFTADLAALTAGVAAFTADSTSFTESDSVYDLTLSVPGVRASDISATIEERTLRVKGETKTQHRHMRFDRSIALPKDADVGSEGLKLVHEDGILTVSVPKREPYRKQLEISVPGQAAAEGNGEAPRNDLYCVSLSVPGVRTSDISATIEERTLRVKGETKTQHRHMRVDRSIALPKDADVGSEGLKLVHEDGILTITVPKREPYRKQLEISPPGQAAVDGVGEASTEQAPKNVAQPPHAACPEA